MARLGNETVQHQMPQESQGPDPKSSTVSRQEIPTLFIGPLGGINRFLF